MASSNARKRPVKRSSTKRPSKRAPSKRGSTSALSERRRSKPPPKRGPTQRPYKRERYPMPAFVKRALSSHKLMAAYRERPPYQQNDYIGWITQAKTDLTRERRLEQMLKELERGNVYMKMKWHTT